MLKSGITNNLKTDKNERLRISNLLYKSLEKTPLYTPINELIKDLRNKIGLNQTVWGIKNINGKVELELYFYRHLQHSIMEFDAILDILSKYFLVERLTFDENLPFTMFSFDIAENMKIENANIYFSKYYEESFHSWSYKLSAKKIEFENHYEVYTQPNYYQIPEKILSSPFVNSETTISEILLPQLMNCSLIFLATKRNRNGIYYQGISINQFIIFLRKFQYPKELIKFVELYRNQLNYILFDIGFDYSIIDNKLDFGKSGFYGTF